MNLIYLNQGERHYGKRPVVNYRRRGWAFQFNLEGACSMTVQRADGEEELRLEGRWLTVAGPECVHGWGGYREDCCEVMVFQFDEADYALRTAIGAEGSRAFPASEGEIAAAAALYNRCSEAQKRPDALSALVFRIAGTELALMALRRLPPVELGPRPDWGKSKVAAALAWYEANLPAAPTIREVAQAVHLSPAHLRRLFHRVRGRSPQAVFTEVQFERATQLLRNPSLTLETIAENAGFGGGSAFSRAFKAAFGVPPKVYRARL